jgi:hypothetical protein
MRMHRTFTLKADGSVSLLKEEPVAQQLPSKLPEILELLQRENPPLAQVVHLIPIEIAQVATYMTALKRFVELHNCGRGIIVLLGLQELVMATVASNDSDGLNFDGPRFKASNDEAVRLCKEAARILQIK